MKKMIFLYVSFLYCFNVLQGMDLEAGLDISPQKIKRDLHRAMGLEKHQTTPAERRQYGYNGTLVAILKHSEIVRVGYILPDIIRVGCIL